MAEAEAEANTETGWYWVRGPSARLAGPGSSPYPASLIDLGRGPASASVNPYI